MLIAHLEREGLAGRALVVGASDGKFVLPLAARGWEVTAVDVDAAAIHGGCVTLPGGEVVRSPGLIERVSKAGFSERVEAIEADFRDLSFGPRFDVVFTSCSWHYSLNANHPVSTFVEAMVAAVKVGGIYCAEYMMPVHVEHFAGDRYLVEGQLRHYLSRPNWTILEEFYTPPFVEAGHVGAREDHVHRMGFLMARRKHQGDSRGPHG